MIPRLAQVEPAQGRYLAFLETLGQQGFQGEIRSDYGTRLVQSTDNSTRSFPRQQYFRSASQI